MMPADAGMRLLDTGHGRSAVLRGQRRTPLRVLAAVVALGWTCVDTNLIAADPALELRDDDRVVLVGATLFERDRHYGRFEAALRTRLPGVGFSFRNMAWPGDTTAVQLRPLNFGSFAEHMSLANPTVVLACYGSNEAFDGDAGLDPFVTAYQAILDTAAQTADRIVLVSPIRHENIGPPFPAAAAHNRSLEHYVAAIEKLARGRSCGYADLFHTLVSNSDAEPAYRLTENGIHLSDYGYWRAAETLADQVGFPRTRFSVQIDAASGRAEATGGLVERLEVSPTGLRFQAASEQLPASTSDEMPADEHVRREAVSIRIRGLSPGRYELQIDGQMVAGAPAAGWSRGVDVTQGPCFAQARALLDEIRWKNRLFFHRWRAHNGEYIYGRRAETSDNWRADRDGGNAGNPTFPQEMAEFERLIAESEQKAIELSKPRKRTYTLVSR